MQEVAFQSLRKLKKLYKHKCHSSISINYCKTLLISKQIVNLDMYIFIVFRPSEFCKIFPQSAGNGISETLDFIISRGSMLLNPPTFLAPSALDSHTFGVWKLLTNIPRSTPDSVALILGEFGSCYLSSCEGR